MSIICRNKKCQSENIQDDKDHEKILCNDCGAYFKMVPAWWLPPGT